MPDPGDVVTVDFIGSNGGEATSCGGNIQRPVARASPDLILAVLHHPDVWKKRHRRGNPWDTR